MNRMWRICCTKFGEMSKLLLFWFVLKHQLFSDTFNTHFSFQTENNLSELGSSKLQFGVVYKSEYKILSGERFAYVDVEPDLNIG